MEVNSARRGYSSLLRWRADPLRDEAKNVAVILVDAEGEFGKIKWVPIYKISSKLHDQGILDSIVEGLRQKVDAPNRMTLSELQSIQQSLNDSLILTVPEPVLVRDPEKTIDALFKAYLWTPSGGSSKADKGYILERLIKTYRDHGVTVARGHYVGDYIFDAVIQGTKQPRYVADVLTFMKPKKKWEQEEYEAGHFLYAKNQLKVEGFAVVQPPDDSALDQTRKAYLRVSRWFRAEGVKVLRPDQLFNGSLPMPA